MNMDRLYEFCSSPAKVATTPAASSAPSLPIPAIFRPISVPTVEACAHTLLLAPTMHRDESYSDASEIDSDLDEHNDAAGNVETSQVCTDALSYGIRFILHAYF